MHFAPILQPSEYSGDGGENLEFVQEVEELAVEAVSGSS